MRKTLGIAAISMLAGTAVYGQDFFNGQPGPSPVQVDFRAEAANGKYSGAVIPKFFTGKWLVAAPFSMNDRRNIGVNFGRIQKLSPDSDLIGALGLFRDSKGGYKVADAQMYFTHTHGRWSVDLESALSVNTRTQQASGRGSATAGYAITERLRVGASGIFQDGKSPEGQVLARFDLPTKNSRHWLEAYGKEDALGFRFAYNPRLRKPR